MKTPKDYIQSYEGYREFRNKVDEILQYFDFEKVQCVMQSLDWRWNHWCDENGDSHVGEVPNTYALRVQAWKLLLHCAEDMSEETAEGFFATGGFEARSWVEEGCSGESPEVLRLSLKFVVKEVEI